MTMILPPGSYIASGPVIIENNKVLLNKERKQDDSVGPWAFPGGKVEDTDATLEDACRREAREELGLELTLLRSLKPMMFKTDGKVVLLIHYVAKRSGDVQPGKDIVAWDWHDVKKLPRDAAPNVQPVIQDYLNTL